MRSFGSDNWSGACPQILQALIDANQGHAPAYGGDQWTQKAVQKFKEVFGEQAEPFFVYNGTAANVLAIDALTKSYHVVLAAQTAHLNFAEAGATEKITNCKMIYLDSPDGKLTPEIITPMLNFFRPPNDLQPKVISISQSTEFLTVYQPDEIKALADFAHQNNMYLHVDGARISNAAALGISLRAMLVDTGVDVLSFGGTKNGLMIGEAVVFFKPELAKDFWYIRKQDLHLASKMRYLAAQFLAYLEGDLYLKNAQHANGMAKLLEEKLRTIAGLEFVAEVQTNGVFIKIPSTILAKLKEKHYFYVPDEETAIIRLICSWDTEEEEINNFVQDLKSLL